MKVITISIDSNENDCGNCEHVISKDKKDDYCGIFLQGLDTRFTSPVRCAGCLRADEGFEFLATPDEARVEQDMIHDGLGDEGAGLLIRENVLELLRVWKMQGNIEVFTKPILYHFNKIIRRELREQD